MLVEKNKVTMRRRRRPKGTRGPGERYHLKVLDRTLDVLECFSDDQSRLNLKDISKLVQFQESSLFRILLTLENRGYLLQHSDGSYQLTAKLLHGKMHEHAARLHQRVYPYLQSLANRFNETASLAYLFGEHIRVLDTLETFQEIRVTHKPGRVLPPHCSSLGKAITAFQDRAFIDRILEAYGLTRRTENTVVDRQALLAEFEQINARGYAIDREEAVKGAVCIGVAIRSKGRVVASISISVPVARMAPEREQ